MENREKEGQSKFPDYDLSTLTDIRDIQIDSGATPEERRRSFLKQTGNPCLFRCGELVVEVQYSDTGKTLEECVTDYIQSQAF